MQGSRRLPLSTKIAGRSSANVTLDKTRLDPIAALIEHCQAAKSISDAEGQKFLSHLLAMTLLAAHELRHAPHTP